MPLDLTALSTPAPRRSAFLEKLEAERTTAAPERFRDRFTRSEGEGPGESEDLARIVALPRRPRPSADQQAAMAEEMTELLRKPDGPCRCADLRPGLGCISDLMPIQGWYLHEARATRGAVGFIAVGGGKTGVDILLPMVVPGVRQVALLLMPELRRQFEHDLLCWSQHFKVPNLAGGDGPFISGRPVLHVLAYSMLSRETCATWLLAQKPDMIIADEAQALKDVNSVRTGRLLRYFATDQAEHTVTCVHSGSLTTKSLADYSHLAALALRENSPVPIEPAVVEEWKETIDPFGQGDDGELRQLCEQGEPVRAGFQRRLVETAGVITTENESLGIGLRVVGRSAEIPKHVKAAMLTTRSRMRPDGEELVEASEVAMTLSQLACGFYYRWKWPRGEPEALINAWFMRRQSWNRELRDKLEHRRDLLDSPKLCRDAAERHHAGYVGDLPTWDAGSFPAWASIENEVQHEVEPVWLDDFLIIDALRWAAEAPSIVWYQHDAFGERLSEIGRVPRYGPSDEMPMHLSPTAEMLKRRAALVELGQWKGGDVAGNWIKTEDGSRSIACSIRAHSTGKNLQAFGRALVCATLGDGGTWEQLIGRMHRPGQRSSVVEIHVYRHSSEMRDALDRALEQAKYVQSTTGKAEKLLFAEMLLDPHPPKEVTP